MRLKEMDRKYNIKRNEVKRGQSNVSTESSLDGSSKDHRPASGHGKPEVDQGLKVAEVDDQTKSKVAILSKWIYLGSDSPLALLQTFEAVGGLGVL